MNDPIENAIQNPNGHKFTLPNTFLLGGSKCASSTLSGWLGQHREILLATPKEPSFFQRDVYQKGMEYYSKKYFRGYNQQKIILDATPDYLHIQYVADRIKETCEDPKFIIMVREPMVRAYSQYMMYKGWRPGLMRNTFEEEMWLNFKSYFPDNFKYEYEVMGSTDFKGGNYTPSNIEQGLFFTHIMRYIKMFGRENVYVNFFETLCEAPYNLYGEITEFLGVEEFEPVLETRNIQEKEPDLLELCKDNPETTRVAKEIFYPEVNKLSNLMEVDLITKWGYDKL